MITFIALIVGLITIISAIHALRNPNMLTSILFLGSMGLSTSILYLLLAAVDVAMTEAAIGCGLTVIIFLFAFRQLKKDRQ